MSTFLSSKEGVRAKKAKRCCLCGERINVGDMKDVRIGAGDGRIWTMHMHPECHAYELIPGTVDLDWYEDIIDPAFDRKDAIAATKK